MKILKVGDLHLYTKEIRSTKKMIENNVVMLEGIYNLLISDEEIKLVLFGGDIQHRTPSGKNTLYETSLWRYWFKKIGLLMQKRYEKNSVRVIDREIGQKLEKQLDDGEILPLFTLEGNHDVDNEVEYTFYDDLLSNGYLVNPLQLVIEEETQINFHNYGEAAIKYEKLLGVNSVIGYYHDTVVTEEMPFWTGGKDEYVAEKVLDGVDLGVINHIHNNYDPIYVNTESGGQSVAWVMGSMGRTSFSEGQLRDHGYCGLVDTNNLEELGTVEIELIKKEEYFNYKAELKSRQNKKDYKDFSLDIGEDVVRQYQDPRNDIRALEDLDDSVVAVCLEILDEVMDKE